MKNILIIAEVICISLLVTVIIQSEVKANDMRKLKTIVRNMYMQNPDTHLAGSPIPTAIPEDIQKWIMEP